MSPCNQASRTYDNWMKKANNLIRNVTRALLLTRAKSYRL